MQQNREPTIDSIELEVNGLCFTGFETGPKAGELVLLLHGFPQFADAWLSVMKLLGKVGLRVVAMNQRGYTPGARPRDVQAYRIDRLVSDVLGFAEKLGADRFHLVGHDWGGLVAWRLATGFPERLKTLSVLSTPHIDAFQQALRTDPDQRNKSKYILLFKAPFPVPEMILLAGKAALLRRAYQGIVPEEQVECNVQRLREPGALRAALNWYRALSSDLRTGPCRVPTLYMWGDQDIALGETAALATAQHCVGEYRFERMRGKSHWLVEEMPAEVAERLLEHRMKNREVGGV